MISIRKYKNSDIKETINLITETFRKFNAVGQNKKSIASYLDQFKNPENIKNSFNKADVFYVATDGRKIIGLIRGGVHGKSGKIGSLFINEKYQNHGLGRRLAGLAEKQFIRSGIKDIKIRSSLHSVDFYEKIGYKKTTGKRKMPTGIVFQPMQKYL